MSFAVASKQRADRRIDRFRRLYDDVYGTALLDLAAHAALPAALSADLVHLLRINFLPEAFDDVCASTSEADLLLSPLCYEIADSLYEIEPVVRDELLQGLVKNHSYARLYEVACLLSEYARLASSWPDRARLKYAQYLTALCVLDPAEAQSFLRERRHSAAEEGLDENWFVAMGADLARIAAVVDREDSLAELTDLGKRTLVGLALFPAPVSRSAWIDVVGLGEDSINDVIAELEKQALVWRDPEDRYKLQVPQSAQRYLANHPELLDELRSNWTAHYVDFVRRNGGKNRRGYAALDGDWTNLKYVLDYVLKRWDEVKKMEKRAAQTERSALARDLVDFGSLLTDYLRLHGESDLRLRLLGGAAVAAADELRQPELVGRFAYEIGWLFCDRQEFDAARSWAEYARGHQGRTQKGSGYPLRLLARIERMRFESELSINHPSYARIEQLLHDAEQAFAQDKDTDGRARTELDWARLAMDCGEYEKARMHFGKAQKYFQAIDYSEGVAIALENIADTFRREGRRSEARRYYQQARDLARRVGVAAVIAETEKQLARLS